MIQPAAHASKLLTFAASTVLIISVLLYASLGYAAFLAVPAAMLFVLLLVFDWKAAYWIVLCSIPYSMQMAIGDNLTTSVPDEPMMWLFFLLFLIGWAANPKMLAAWWWEHPIVLIVVLQTVWLIVAVCCSKVGFISFKFLIAKLWFLVCFFVLPVFVFRKKADFRKGFLMLFIPMLITMVVVTIKHGILGFEFATVEHAIGGIYHNHVEYSSIMSMFLPLVLLAYWLTDRNRRTLKIFLGAMVVFFVIAVLLTYARAALLGLAFGGLIAFAIKRKFAHRIMPACYAVIALVLIYLVPNKRFMALQPDYSNTYMHYNFADHMVATFRGQDLSSMERLYRWVAAFRMSRDEPLTGFGPHAFYYYYQPYALQEFRTYTSDNPERSTTHNYFLLMLTEQGWPAMLLYALLMAVAIKQAQQTYHRFSDRFYKAVTLGLAALLAVNFVNNFFSELIETHKVGALFYLALSLLVVLDHKSRKDIAL